VTAVLQTVAMALVGVFATGVVLTREPLRQVIAMGPFGVSLVVLLTILQAPDVVLSAIVVGAFAYPVMVLLALAKIRGREDEG
jgi:energy-converting hydrogenase B subunit D